MLFIVNRYHKAKTTYRFHYNKSSKFKNFQELQLSGALKRMLPYTIITTCIEIANKY